VKSLSAPTKRFSAATITAAALGETEQQVLRLEREQADNADRKQRAATAAEIEKRSLALAKASDDFVLASGLN
jgi:hypothetical protein